MHRREIRRHTLRTRREFFGSEAHRATLAEPSASPAPATAGPAGAAVAPALDPAARPASPSGAGSLPRA